MGATTAVGFGADLRWDLGVKILSSALKTDQKGSFVLFHVVPQILSDSSEANAGEEVNGEPEQ